MSFNLIELALHFCNGHVRVVEVALLDVAFGEEVLVVFEGFDYLCELISLDKSKVDRGGGNIKRGNGREGKEKSILLLSGSALNKCLNMSVLRVAFPVHMSHTLSLRGSATNSYSGPSMTSLGQTSGGWALGSLEASRG